jgi:hypothetical protein
MVKSRLRSAMRSSIFWALIGSSALVGSSNEHRQCRIGDTLLNEGDMLALDGNTGAVHAGTLAVVQERPEAALATIAGWRSAAA